MANFTLTKTISPAIDISVFSASSDVSSTADAIRIFFRGNMQPTSTIRLQLRSSSGAGDIAEYVLRARTTAQTPSQVGLGSLDGTNETSLTDRTNFVSINDREELSLAIAEKSWISTTLDWQSAIIPKLAFTRKGDFEWATSSTIDQVVVIFEGLAGGSAGVSDIELIGGGQAGQGGGGGLMGNYKYRITFFNSVTGNRSNAGDAIQVAENVQRGYVALSNIPTAADGQVDTVEIWRTLGDGTRFFKAATVASGTATFDDGIADHDSIDAILGASILSSTELPLDNAPPTADFDDCIIDSLQAFWISNGTGKQGRVFFSPSGRPESFSDFINVTEAGDPLHKLVLFKSQRFVFSESRVHRIDSTSTGILLSREISGVPGVQFAQRRTVVATPVGIMYQATDGIRVFDGSTSGLISFEAVGKLFRGEAAENLTAFEGIVATFARGEYIISDGTQSLAVNVQDLSWREIGFNDITALFYEWDADSIQAGRTANAQLIEAEGVFLDAGSDIAFEWETVALDFPNDQVLLVERIYSDIDTQAETVTPTLVHLDGTITLGTLTAATRTAKLTDVQRLVRKPSVRYTGTVGAQVTLFDVELEFREVVLGVKFPDGKRIQVPGRTTTINTQITFLIDPPDRRLEGESFIPFIDRLQLDINTGGLTVVPVILTAEGNEIIAADVVTNIRETVEIAIERTNAIRGLRLEADFTQDIQLFAAELSIRNTTLSLVIL